MALDLRAKRTAHPPCVQVFRYRENNYASSGRIVFAQEWRHMKRLSCHGECCEGDSIRRCWTPFDDVEQAGIEELQIAFPDDPVDGALYQFILRPGTPDWETGVVEDWEWEVVPFEPEVADGGTETGA